MFWTKKTVVGEKKKKKKKNYKCCVNIVQRDKTWDCAFCNMSDEDYRLVMAAANEKYKDTMTNISEEKRQLDKLWALQTYCKLYRDVARKLLQWYPHNIRVYDMQDTLNEAYVQEDLLHWCGFNKPVLDTRLYLNRKK